MSAELFRPRLRYHWDWTHLCLRKPRRVRHFYLVTPCARCGAWPYVSFSAGAFVQ